MGGDFTVSTFTPATSTVILNGNGNAAIGLAGGYSFDNLTVGKGTTTATVTPAGTVTVGGTLALTEGTWIGGATQSS